MATQYPQKIDDSSTLPKVIDNISYILADTVNRIRDAIIAVQTELGINPSGTYSSVKDRFDTLEKQFNKIAELEQELDALKAIVDAADFNLVLQTLTNLQAEIDAININIVSINNDISDLNTNLSGLQTTLQLEIDHLQSEIDDHTNDISNLTNTINNLDIPNPLTVLVNGSEVLTNVSALDFIGNINSNTVDGYKVELTFNSGGSSNIGQVFVQVMNSDSETDLFAVSDGLFTDTPWAQSPSLTPIVLDFVFPNPWHGGDIIVNGITFGGVLTTQTFGSLPGGGRVRGDVVFFFINSYSGTSSGGADGTTGHFQYGNGVCVPHKTISSFDLLLNGTFGGSISAVTIVTPELAKGFARITSYAFGDQLTMYYTI